MEKFGYVINPGDVTLSFLPLAHTFEYFNISRGLIKGAAIGFYSGNVAVLMEDMAILKPNVQPMVPRVLT